jgi:hypothetical protein
LSLAHPVLSGFSKILWHQLWNQNAYRIVSLCRTALLKIRRVMVKIKDIYAAIPCRRGSVFHWAPHSLFFQGILDRGLQRVITVLSLHNALLLSSTIRPRLSNSGVIIVMSSSSHLVLIRACYEKSLSLSAILKRWRAPWSRSRVPLKCFIMKSVYPLRIAKAGAIDMEWNSSKQGIRFFGIHFLDWASGIR